MNYWAKDHTQKTTLVRCDGSESSDSSNTSSSDTKSGSGSTDGGPFAHIPVTARTHVGRASLMIDTMTRIFKVVPPSSATAWLRILANALCTNARFGKATRACVFGCALHGDHLAHYLACPILYGSLDDVFRIGVGASMFGNWRLNIEAKDDQARIVIMCVADCMQTSYHSLSNGTSTNLREVIIARRRFVTLRSEAMNEAVNCRIRGIDSAGIVRRGTKRPHHGA